MYHTKKLKYPSCKKLCIINIQLKANEKEKKRK